MANIFSFKGNVFYHKNNGDLFECFKNKEMKKANKDLIYKELSDTNKRTEYMIITENQIDIFKMSLDDKNSIAYLTSPIYSIEAYRMYGMISDEEYNDLKSKITENQALNKDDILFMIRNDIDYIPTLEELELVKDKEILLGEAPIFTIKLSNNGDINRIDAIQKSTKESRPGGLYELYTQLEVNGECRSYSESNILYVGYTLAKENIDFDILGYEYKNKMKAKKDAISELSAK